MRESPAQIALAGEELHCGNGNAIQEVAASVRKRHPEASKGAVINYLLTAYCSGFNTDNALNHASRRAAMEKFAKQAEAAVE